MLNDWFIVLLDHPSPGHRTLQYIGFIPDPGILYKVPCSDFLPYAKLYDLNRQFCHGTWSVTRGGIQLVEGSWHGTIAPPEKQEVIVHNTLFLGVWYMSSLVEILGPFATATNNSMWTSPYMATSLAAMVWSRITILNSPISQHAKFKAPDQLARLSPEEAGLVYPVNDNAIYIRPTLKKSPLLYIILAVQPLLIIVILVLVRTVFHPVPIRKGFGLVSILAGIDRQSLDILAGATLSGELNEATKLVIKPIGDDKKGAVEYQVCA